MEKNTEHSPPYSEALAPAISHDEFHSHDDSNQVAGFVADQEEIPRGYFLSPSFLGTMMATGLGLCCAVGGFGLAAPNLTLINNEIGPSKDIAWVSLVYTLTLAVGLLLVGRLSDLFGRRYFFIGAAAMALIGCIVAAVAKNVETLIGGTALIGLAASGQQSFAFITGELVPMKHRFAINAVMYVFCAPFAALGPAISKALILHTSAGWRWCYYIMIIINFASGLLFALFYFPPTFHEKFQDRKPIQQLKQLDYVGILLFVAGLFVFLLGLSWGGQQYPWKSAAVIATMIIGGVTMIAFVLWEMYAKLKEPLLPMHLFANLGWVASIILLGLGASIYYALGVIWPQMIAVLYTTDGGASMYAGWLACAPSAMINFGQIVGGFMAEPLGRTKLQIICALIIGGALLGGVAAATPDSKALAIGLIMVSSFFIGWNESVTLSLSGIELLDQREIGTAVGAAGSMRSTISSIASAIYLTVLNNRLTARIPAEVVPAITKAGLPAKSVPAFLAGLTSGSFTGIQGLTDKIMAAGQMAYQDANAQAYSTVFLATIAFSGVAIILSFFAQNVDDKMTGQVAAKLSTKSKTPDAEKAVQENL